MKISSSSVHLILMFCVHAVPCILFISDFDIFITSLFVLFCASITIRHCRVSHLFSTFLFFRISFSYYHVHRRTKECMLSAHRNIFGVNKKNMYLFICVCVFFFIDVREYLFFVRYKAFKSASSQHTCKTTNRNKCKATNVSKKMIAFRAVFVRIHVNVL